MKEHKDALQNENQKSSDLREELHRLNQTIEEKKTRLAELVSEEGRFRNIYQRFPDRQFSVFVLTNRQGPDAVPLANQVVDHLLFND